MLLKPTILFWNPKIWEMNDEAEPYFDNLRQVSILFDSPEDAAARVVDLYENPWEWWNRKEVQEANHRFLERFALARADWLCQWAEALEKELELAQMQ